MPAMPRPKAKVFTIPASVPFLPALVDALLDEAAAATPLAEAVAVVLKHRRASISLVQRHLRIGYNRAARLLELNEAVNEAVKGLKAKGLESPYLKAFVVSRVNHLRWVKEKHPDFDDTLNTILKAAKRFNPANVKPDIADFCAVVGVLPGVESWLNLYGITGKL